jgi:glycosyltransferase involved in cell wall biosynthesis
VVESLDLDTLETVTCVRHDENQGANAARNTGLARTTGEYVALLDDDDYWEPTKVERQVAALETDPEAGVCFTGQRYVDGDGETVHVRTPATDGEFLRRLVDGANFGGFSAVLVDAAVVDAAGDLDERFPSWQDREWYYRLAERTEFVTVTEPLTVRRFAGQDQLTDDYERKRDVSYPLFLAEHRRTAATLGPDAVDRFEATFARTLAAAALQHDAYRDAARFALRAIRHDPTDVGAYGYLAVSLGGDHTYHLARTVKRAVNGVRARTAGGATGSAAGGD